ncbi:hypothetical protein R3W88_024945 [Solanum pinnatisectum]|uniref:Prolamin-like domain-containing protein n=1 Tax=Solanum pinnatisectum TaxID=50273 RepID=A0AAV9M3H1_9SOLN|nr:hypothetical protein R3W88_024945 [Solanum pinnatisectum]
MSSSSRSATLLGVFLLLGCIVIVTATEPKTENNKDLFDHFRFQAKISLSTQCCQVLSTFSDDCFYKEFTHSNRVPFFLGKVRNYCSHHQG